MREQYIVINCQSSEYRGKLYGDRGSILQGLVYNECLIAAMSLQQLTVNQRLKSITDSQSTAINQPIND